MAGFVYYKIHVAEVWMQEVCEGGLIGGQDLRPQRPVTNYNNPGETCYNF